MNERRVWSLIWRILRVLIVEIEQGECSPFVTDVRRGLLLVAAAIRRHKMGELKEIKE